MSVIKKIETLHSECSLMEKAARVAYLHGQWNRLNTMAYQLGAYLHGRLHITEAERQQALWLIEAMEAVQNEEKKASRELAGESLKEFVKTILR